MALGILVGIWFGVNLPFQLLCGYSQCLESGTSFGRWVLLSLRSSIVIGLVYYGTLWMLIFSLSSLGILGLFALTAIEMVVLTGFTFWIARIASPFPGEYGSDKGRSSWTLRSPSGPFTGSVVGLPGNESLVMPGDWQKQLPEKTADVFLLRRHALINQGAHGRGFLYAIGWNLLALGLAVFLSSDSGSPIHMLISMSCWFSLFTVVGWIGPLRWANRLAVLETDAWAYYQQIDLDYIRDLAVRIDELRWGKDAGNPLFGKSWVAVPSAGDRAAHFGKEPGKKGGWNAVGQSVLMSWAGLSVFSQSLPQMMGKPTFRVIPFSD